jgi:hypothetical protein
MLPPPTYPYLNFLPLRSYHDFPLSTHHLIIIFSSTQSTAKMRSLLAIAVPEDARPVVAMLHSPRGASEITTTGHMPAYLYPSVDVGVADSAQVSCCLNSPIIVICAPFPVS